MRGVGHRIIKLATRDAVARIDVRGHALASRRSVGEALSTLSRVKNLKQNSGTLKRIMAEASTWDASQSQADFMRNDRVILVTPEDVVVGDESKENAHQFIQGKTPSGALHRAFSVFLFDKDDRLLLQQRAANKITFPSVWTNTCCSHQLTGQVPDEIDHEAAITSGTCVGAKRAATRKLRHELGIEPSEVPTESIKFLTRLHYCAADQFAENENQPVGGTWGEHEMDYILFAKIDTAGEDLPMKVNAEEIDDAKWVSASELKAMMDPSSGLRWSPWFRIIAERFLHEWWADLDAALTTDKYVDVETIHKVM
jgi:isopentenyl-diphosphate delta-isomerase